MLEATKIIREKEYGEWAVQLRDSESGRYYWMDVSFIEDEHIGNDIRIDWNQYIFYLTDEDDLERKAFQENCDNFDEAIDEVMDVLMGSEVSEDDTGAYIICVENWEEKTFKIRQ